MAFRHPFCGSRAPRRGTAVHAIRVLLSGRASPGTFRRWRARSPRWRTRSPPAGV